ncbi:MAG: lipopolysaccharide heptosyltransferase II [Omnitrophica bacterium]|nr:lipopolysaccharide heptosyltransferase II [Candidatus Omnitrophota bacterium]
MNILQVVAKLDSSDRAWDVIKAARFLTLNGHKACCASQKSDLVRKIDEVGARHYTLDMKANIFSIIKDVLTLARIIETENINVVHTMCGLSSFVAFFATRFKERTLISTIYEYGGKSFFDKAQTWAKRIICFSESETRHFARDGLFLQDKVSLIPPFVEVDSRTAKSPTEPVWKGGTYFTIGAMVPFASKNDTQSFVRAVSILVKAANNIRIFITSKSPTSSGDIEKLKLFIKRQSLDGVITFLSGIEWRKLIGELDLFVQVNLQREILVTPILQASSRGIPVVTTRVPWLKDYVEEGNTAAVCENGNPKELADKILTLYKDGSLRLRMANMAKDFIREKFDITKIMNATLRLYEEALSSVKILIIKIGALGDVILISPSIYAIRKKFPNAKIKLLTGVDKREIFANCPYINDIIVCDFKERDRGIRGLFRVAGKLRYEDFDIVVDLQNNKKSHILSFLSSAPRRCGYDNGKLSFLLNKKVKDVKLPMDPVRHQSKILGLLGIYDVREKLNIWLSKEDEEWAARFLDSHWVKGNARLVAINLGASSRWVTKLWPVEYFADISNRLAKNLNARILLIGAESSSVLSDEFLKRAKCKPINALGKTNIPRLAALIKRCMVLVSSDSAPLHVASAVDTPFIALFGPTDPKRHLVPSGNYTVLRKDISCSPCYSAHCHLHYKCMTSIKPDEVYEAVVKLGIRGETPFPAEKYGKGV